jgi:hypothetical protein
MSTLQLYTWNVLSSYIYANQTIWKSCSSKTLVKLDYQRSKYRQNVQFKIIEHWLKSKKVIVCLQEVDNTLLSKLKKLPREFKIYCSEHQHFLKKHSRLVTIVKGTESTNEEINIHDRSILKTCINDIDIFNVHFYWKWDNEYVARVGKSIANISKLKFIILGDMNKQILELSDFIDKLTCIHLFDETGYTSIFNLNKLYIDHIMVSSTIVPLRNPKVIGHVGKYKIIYNVNKLCQLHNDNKLTLNTWINKRKYNDLSDHKPIMIRVQI